jgi:diguanylate cyclase
MIALAGALGIGTVAEGVEKAEAAETPSALGCDHVQGYLIARPMAFGDTLVWLAESDMRSAAGTASRLA